MARLPLAMAMPSWRTPPAPPPPECVVVVIGLARGRVHVTVAAPPSRCLHAYGPQGVSALCGTPDWSELVPPGEATCPVCRARSGNG